MRLGWPRAEQSLDFARSVEHDHARHRAIEKTRRTTAGTFGIGQLDTSHDHLSNRCSHFVLIDWREFPYMKIGNFLFAF